MTAGAKQRVTLARNQFDECRLAAAVRAQNRDVLAGLDGEAQAVESQTRAALNGHIFKLE